MKRKPEIAAVAMIVGATVALVLEVIRIFRLPR